VKARAKARAPAAMVAPDIKPNLVVPSQPTACLAVVEGEPTPRCLLCHPPEPDTGVIARAERAALIVGRDADRPIEELSDKVVRDARPMAQVRHWRQYTAPECQKLKEVMCYYKRLGGSESPLSARFSRTVATTNAADAAVVVVGVPANKSWGPLVLTLTMGFCGFLAILCGLFERVKRWWRPPVAAASRKLDPVACRLAWSCPSSTDAEPQQVRKALAVAAGGYGLRQEVEPVNAASAVVEAYVAKERAHAEITEFVDQLYSAPRSYYPPPAKCLSALLVLLSSLVFVMWIPELVGAGDGEQERGSRWSFIAGLALLPFCMRRRAAKRVVVDRFDPDDLVLPVVNGAYELPALSTTTICLGFGDEKKLGEHCRVEVKKTPACCTPATVGGTLVGWTTGLSYVLRKCLCNAHNALCMRHGTTQPSIRRDLASVFGDFAGALRGYDADYLVHPMREYETWLLKWPEGRRRSFRDSRLWHDVLPQKVKAMVKREINHTRPSKARLIQYYCNDATQSEFGPEFYALQKVMCRVFSRCALAGGVDVTFASGMTANELSGWMASVVADGAVCFYERDGKNWDSSMQEMHAEFRIGLYEVFDSTLADFARACRNVTGFAAFPGGVLRYRTRDTVKSGHNDTTLGNSIVNAAIAYASLRVLGKRASILVAGDDLLVAAYDQIECEKMVAVERDFGITPEARVFADPEQVTFISGMWLHDGEQFCFLPLIGRLFARLWWTTRPPPARKLAAYLRGVSRGLAPTCQMLPLVRTLLSKFDTEGEASRSDKGYTFRGSWYVIHDGIYDALFRRYGVSRADVERCERWLRELSAQPMLIVHDVLTRISEVDLADIADRGASVGWGKPR
jgi:hypothetical protein